jgi:hypothetical protein
LLKHSGVVDQHIKSVIPLLELGDHHLNRLLDREFNEQQAQLQQLRLLLIELCQGGFAAFLVTTPQDDCSFQLC